MLQKLMEGMSFFVASRNVQRDSAAAAAATDLTDDATAMLKNVPAIMKKAILQEMRISPVRQYYLLMVSDVGVFSPVTYVDCE